MACDEVIERHTRIFDATIIGPSYNHREVSTPRNHTAMTAQQTDRGQTHVPRQ